jgi:hypothetical protein
MAENQYYGTGRRKVPQLAFSSNRATVKSLSTSVLWNSTSVVKLPAW